MTRGRVTFDANGIEHFEDELREACKQRRVGLYINARARRLRQPHVFLKQRGSTLGVFYSCREALTWLVPTWSYEYVGPK